MTPRPKLLLVDGFSLAFRAYYAYPPSLRLANGLVVNAVYGFIALLFREIEDFQPDSIGVCFDRKEPTFRHIEYEAYKAHRTPAPEDFILQITHLKELLKTIGITSIEQPGFEADDLLGTFSRQASEAGYHVRIMTGDHDALQLVTDHIEVVMSKKSKLVIFTPAQVRAVYGLNPCQIIDYKALVGDTSDNIPGVPGIGDKTATTLLTTYPTLQDIYDNLEAISPKGVQQKLANNTEMAWLSYRLATIDQHVALFTTVDHLGFTPNWPVIVSAFRDYEFRTLVKKYEAYLSPVQSSLLDQDAHLPLSQTEPPSLDILRQGFAIQITESHCGMAIKNQMWDLLWTAELAHYLKPILEDNTVEKWAFEGKKVIMACKKQLINIEKLTFDSCLAGYVLDPGAPPDLQKLLTITNQSHPRLDAHNIAHMALSVIELKPHLEALMTTRHVDTLMTSIELPLQFVLVDMELYGVLLDTVYLDTLKKRLQETLDEVITTCYSLAGMTFNIASPKQLGDVLYDHLHLPVLKKTKTQRSTDSSVLEKLSEKYPIAKYLLIYRQLEKLLSTYINTLPGLINSKTGRIHTSFNQMVAATGRLSSTNPNLQNIPIRSEEGLAIRQAFIPSQSDYVLISADYSQIELRILAQLTQDAQLIQAFQNGEDIHTATASSVFGTPKDEVTKAQRYQAKAINFGIIYGVSAYGLSEQLQIPAAEAKAIIDHYFEMFPSLKAWMTDTLEFARKNDYVVTEFGRIRSIPMINAGAFPVRQFAERTAINTRIQGTAADIMKVAMIRVAHALTAAKCKARLMIQVHDELVLDVPTNEVDQVTAILRHEMEHVVDWSVPLDIDVAVGKNWKEIS